MVLGSVPDYLADSSASGAGAEPVLLENNGFFPVISLRDFESRYQVDDSYQEDRRIDLLLQATREANRELQEKVCEWIQAGHFDLASVQTMGFVGNCDDLVAEYRNAVYACAAAKMNAVYRGTDTKEYAVPRAKAMEETAAHHHNQYRQSLLALLGSDATGLTAELL